MLFSHRLKQISYRLQFERFDCVFFKCRAENYRWRIFLPKNVPSRFTAVHPRHSNIQQNAIWTQIFTDTQSFQTSAYIADYLVTTIAF